MVRSEEAGVATIICVGYDVETSRQAVALAGQDPRVYATVGVHPNDVAAAPTDWKGTVSQLARQPRVVAIGETGLDYYRDNTPREDQIVALRWHLDLADELELPVVLHNRESDEDLTEQLLRWCATRVRTTPPGVLHSFCGSAHMMGECARAGFAISFSGMVTFANRSLAYLGDVVKQVPTGALLVETDSPYLAPVPHRGSRNEPSFVRAVAERVAELRGVTIGEIERTTTSNAGRVFPRIGTATLG